MLPEINKLRLARAGKCEVCRIVAQIIMDFSSPTVHPISNSPLRA